MTLYHLPADQRQTGGEAAVFSEAAGVVRVAEVSLTAGFAAHLPVSSDSTVSTQHFHPTEHRPVTTATLL